MVYKRSYRNFSQDACLKDISKICWLNIYDEKEPDEALELLLRKFQPFIDKHAPVRKLTVRTWRAPWIDKEFKDCMS